MYRHRATQAEKRKIRAKSYYMFGLVEMQVLECSTEVPGPVKGQGCFGLLNKMNLMGLEILECH